MKLTDVRSGQEYLLVATKINLKGALVETAHVLVPGSPLKLSLRLPDHGEPIDMAGEVHKVAENPGGGTGMIVRFVNASPQAIHRIEKYLTKAPAPEAPASSAREQTMLADINTLSRLSLSVPADETPAVSTTMDEELMHAQRPGLSGETRLMAQADIEPKKVARKRRSIFALLVPVVAISGLGAVGYSIWNYLVAARKTTGPSVETLVTGIAPSPRPTRPPASTSPDEPRFAESETPEPTPKPAPVTERLKEAATETTEAFVKVTLRGQGNFARMKVSRATGPNRLHLDFPTIRSFDYKPSLSVGENPLLRIRTGMYEKGLRVTLELYPFKFPRYEAKTHPDSVDIYLHR